MAYGGVGLTNTIFGATLTPVAGEYGVALATAGLLVSIQYIGFVVAGPISGELADRMGQTVVIPAGFVLLALGLALFALAHWWPLALAAALLLGVGFGVCGATINTYVAELNPDRRGWAVGLVQFAFGCGSILSPFVAAVLLAGARSWRLLFALDTAVALAALALFACMLHPTRLEASGLKLAESPRKQQIPSLGTIWLTPGLGLLALMLTCYMGVQAGLTAWIAPYIQRSLGAAPALATLGGTTLWIGITGGRLMSSFIGERVGYLRTVLASATIGLLLLLGLLTLGSAGLAVAVATIVGLAYGACYPMILVAGGRLLPDRPNAATGALMGAGAIGAIVVPWLAGQATAAGHQTAAMLVLAGVGLGLLALAGWFVYQQGATHENLPEFHRR